MKNKILSILLLAATFVFLLSGCEDEEKYTVARVTYVSSTSLTFQAVGGTQTITVYADHEWTCNESSVPSWVTVSPMSSDQVETVVEITTSMYVTESLDSRTATIIFEGETVESQSSLLITQKADIYLNVSGSTISEVCSMSDGTLVIVPNAIVKAVGTGGYIVSDASNSANIFLETSQSLSMGDEITIYGSKGSTGGLPTIVLDEWDVVSTGNTVTYPTPTDITANIDSYSSTSWDYVCVTGSYKVNNNTLTLKDRNRSVSVTSVSGNFALADYLGERLTLTGYFTGSSSSAINLIATALEDLGAVIVYYFEEDFEWLAPWADTYPCDDCIAKNTTSTSGCQQIGKLKYDGTTALEELLAAGYDFKRVKYENGQAVEIGSDDECVYMQAYYLKFGKTAYQSGIVFKPISSNPEPGAEVIMQFDWSPMMKGSGKMDEITLTLSLFIDGKQYDIAIPPHGVPADTMTWVTATVDLTEYGITKDTVIQLLPDQWGTDSSTFRFFLDNIYIYSDMEQ